jgi:hypothetical protein
MTAFLPYLFILICPLMMLFMMRGMHGQRSHDARDQGAFDEHGRLRQGQSLTLLADERDRLEEQLAELDAEIDAKAGRATQSHEAVLRTARPS